MALDEGKDVCWRINNVTCLTAIICELFFTRCRHTKWSILSAPAIYELLGLLRPLGPFISTSRKKAAYVRGDFWFSFLWLLTLY